MIASGPKDLALDSKSVRVVDKAPEFFVINRISNNKGINTNPSNISFKPLLLLWWHDHSVWNWWIAYFNDDLRLFKCLALLLVFGINDLIRDYLERILLNALEGICSLT